MIKQANPVYLALQKNQLCSCGSGTWGIVKLLLERADALFGEEKVSDAPSFYAPTEDASGLWVEFGAHTLEHFGYLEHGMSVGFSWLTEDGEIVLKWLRENGTDEDNWPEDWSYSAWSEA